MDVAPLTRNGPPGSPPGSTTNSIWELVRQRSSGGGTYYIRGHLLNENLHGSGREPRNLAPISRSANAQHEEQIEHAVKTRVLEQNQTVHYSVTLGWGGHRRNVNGLKAEVATEFAEDRRERIAAILDAEQKLPSSLTAFAVELNVESNGPVGSPFINHRTIPLEIPDNLQGFDGRQPRQLITLTSPNRRTTIAMLMAIPTVNPPITQPVAEAILAAVDRVVTSRPGRLTRYEQISQVDTSLSGVVEQLQHDRYVKF
jgi:hypothetical protein